MNFSKLFPLTAWFWRQISSRCACRVYLCCLVIIVIPAVLLRVEAAIFERQVVMLASDLSSLRIGVTTKAEALSRIPSLTAISSKGRDYSCPGEECFSAEIPNSKLSDWTLLRAGQTGHATLFALLQSWGIRYWSFDGYVNFSSGTVSGFSYRLMLSAPRAYPVPGAILVGASSGTRFGRGKLDWERDESPNYEVYHYFKWPALHTGVYFTRDAPVELVRHAFDLHLQCVWSLGGCEAANQLLPEAEQDRLRIRQAALQRMSGSDQCPNRILLHRARDTEDILLVEVKDTNPTIMESGAGAYRVASFRLLQVLKGKADRPLDNVWVTTQVEGEVTARNSAVDLLSPGQHILLFSGASTNIDEPCEAMAGTEDAVLTIEKALSAAP